MLNDRQKIILEIIETNDVSDQNALMEMLLDRGIAATQATISRDIRKLNLRKTRVRNAEGAVIAKYTIPSLPQSGGEKNKFAALYQSALVSVDCAQNIIVIKTNAGMAQAVCAAFDSAGFEHIVGSLAGDDTIFIVCKTSEDAQQVTAMLDKINA